jgi:hypothetical protein
VGSGSYLAAKCICVWPGIILYNGLIGFCAFVSDVLGVSSTVVHIYTWLSLLGYADKPVSGSTRLGIHINIIGLCLLSLQ